MKPRQCEPPLAAPPRNMPRNRNTMSTMPARSPSRSALTLSHQISPGLALALLMLPMLLMPGCETERRVISVRGGLSGIEGARGGDLASSQSNAPARSKAYAQLAAKQRQQTEAADPSANQNSIRIRHEDGSVTLILTSPRHVVIHLRQTLTQDEPELLYDQVLSNEAKEEYRRNGHDPREAVEFLFKHRREVLKLLQRMPMGELTPGMFLTKIGPNAYRMKVSGASAQGLSFQRLDIIWEHGVCKLLSIG